MSVYLIVLHEPDPTAWERVRETWPDRCFIVNDHTAFVAPPPGVLSHSIADTLGMNGEKKVSGIVVGTETLAGFAASDAVEWIQSFR